VHKGQNRIERLDEGGPVLGMLPTASYSAGTVEVQASDMLVLYSDGINEATDRNEKEFGEDRIKELITNTADATPAEVCERVMNRVTAFASDGAPPDDRTLLVVRFPQSEADLQYRNSGKISVGAIA
ncbi:MAG: serine/threonine-protein phosphatase, partial [Acidobacteriaceae bacterium]|nr:serine/threonine-protein phosphatase [Acidobacteriaceae bacterium]MBV9940095.1 serine/threonine-protein phosphatase [Acidobacteriaceae bacterium]